MGWLLDSLPYFRVEVSPDEGEGVGRRRHQARVISGNEKRPEVVGGRGSHRRFAVVVANDVSHLKVEI